MNIHSDSRMNIHRYSIKYTKVFLMNTDTNLKQTYKFSYLNKYSNVQSDFNGSNTFGIFKVMEAQVVHAVKG